MSSLLNDNDSPSSASDYSQYLTLVHSDSFDKDSEEHKDEGSDIQHKEDNSTGNNLLLYVTIYIRNKFLIVNVEYLAYW